MLYSSTVPVYLLHTLLDNFAMDLVAFRGGHSKRGVWLLGVFFSPLLTHLARPETIFLPLSKPKMELAEEIITPLEFKEGH